MDLQLAFYDELALIPYLPVLQGLYGLLECSAPPNGVALTGNTPNILWSTR